MTTIYKYQRAVTPGPNGTTLYFRNTDTDPRANELCEIDGWWYVAVPDTAVMPEQWPEINWQQVVVDANFNKVLREKSRNAQFIHEEFLETVRGKYTLDDELYFARISIGAIQGTYQLLAGEPEELAAYQTHVEAARAVKRTKMQEIGL